MVAACRVVLASLGVASCVAAPKTEIRIVHRPLVVEESAPGLLPFRLPEAPGGPRSMEADSIGCLKGVRVQMDYKTVLLDLCHYKNVTFIEEETEAQEPRGGTHDASGGDSTDAASLDGSVAGDAGSSHGGHEEAGASPYNVPKRQILGIYRGWKMDPILKTYKQVVFDDGDECLYGRRYSIIVDVEPNSDEATTPRVRDFRKIEDCVYGVRVEMYVPEYQLSVAGGIHDSAIVDITNTDETVSKLCAQQRCQYESLANDINSVAQQVNELRQKVLELKPELDTAATKMTQESAGSLLESSSSVLMKSLELFNHVEERYKVLFPPNADIVADS